LAPGPGHRMYDQYHPLGAVGVITAYGTLKIGNALDETNHMGPLIDQQAIAAYRNALDQVRAQGGEVLYGG
jgi:aldehyde dehydrogenase (NAD+)